MATATSDPGERRRNWKELFRQLLEQTGVGRSVSVCDAVNAQLLAWRRSETVSPDSLAQWRFVPSNDLAPGPGMTALKVPSNEFVVGALEAALREMTLAAGNEWKLKDEQLRNAFYALLDLCPPDMPLVITIDGPPSIGKSEVARRIAANYGLHYLDAGLLFRALAHRLLELGVDRLEDGVELGEWMDRAGLDGFVFDYRTDPPNVIVATDRSLDVAALDTPRVRELARALAKKEEVRQRMRNLQRELCRTRDRRAITDGQSQGSEVFWDADVKFYFDASAKARAEWLRREESEIERNDRELTLRRLAPLCRPRDAVLIDVSSMAIDEAINSVSSYIDRYNRIQARRLNSPEDAVIKSVVQSLIGHAGRRERAGNRSATPVS